MNAMQEAKHFAVVIGSYIKSKREERNISLRKLYKLSGVSIAVICDFENGKALPRIESILRIVKALNLGNNEINELSNLIMSEFNINSTPTKSKTTLFTVLKSDYGYSNSSAEKIVDYAEYIRTKG